VATATPETMQVHESAPATLTRPGNVFVKGHYVLRGELHPAYIDGRSHLPYTEDWPLISLAMRRRDGFKCQRCFGPSRRLHVPPHRREQVQQSVIRLEGSLRDLSWAGPCRASEGR